MSFNKIISIIFFFIAVLLINSLGNKKATVSFLVLVILGQLVFNANKFDVKL